MSERPPVNDDDEPKQGPALYLGVLAAVIAAVVLAWFAMEFADWNEQQSCVLSGRRNCVPESSTR
jgi:hypothetical protein